MARQPVPFLDTRTASAISSPNSSDLQLVELSRDPATGAITHLLRAPAGWQGKNTGPNRVQYHTVDEELFVLDGNILCDDWHVYEQGGYFYRPAWVLHGFGDASPKGCQAIVKLTGPMDRPIRYDSVSPGEWKGQEDYRSSAEIYSARQVLDFVDTTSRGWDTLNSGAQLQRLSHDPQTGATTFLMRLPYGWSGRAPIDVPHANETYVIEGDLELAGMTPRYSAGTYCYFPADWEPEHSVRSETGCLALRWLLA